MVFNHVPLTNVNTEDALGHSITHAIFPNLDGTFLKESIKGLLTNFLDTPPLICAFP